MTQRAGTDKLFFDKPRKAEVNTVRATVTREDLFVGQWPIAMVLSCTRQDNQQTTAGQPGTPSVGAEQPTRAFPLRQTGLSPQGSRGGSIYSVGSSYR
jgi:hypothetical protein